MGVYPGASQLVLKPDLPGSGDDGSIGTFLGGKLMFVEQCVRRNRAAGAPDGELIRLPGGGAIDGDARKNGRAFRTKARFGKKFESTGKPPFLSRSLVTYAWPLGALGRSRDLCKAQSREEENAQDAASQPQEGVIGDEASI